MKQMIETLRAEEARLQNQLTAVRATLAAYEVPAMVTAAMNGAHVQRKPKRRAAQVKPRAKARKERVAITEAIRAEVIRLKTLPEQERPSIPKIAAKMGIAGTSVQRIWKEHRAALPVVTAAL